MLTFKLFNPVRYDLAQFGQAHPSNLLVIVKIAKELFGVFLAILWNQVLVKGLISTYANVLM